MKKMMKCSVCHSYTLSAQHCERTAVSAHPQRFNPNDRYGDYRRKAKYGG